MHKWAEDLFPINRSLTGEGVRQTLNYLKKILPDLEIKSVPTGYEAFDWTVPEEWSVSEAFIEDEHGVRIVDFKVNNLHLVGYSVSVDEWLTFDELNAHLYSLPEQPDAIPYVTSYYTKRWGFCLTHSQRQQLNKDGKYHVVIKSEHKKGVLNYAELVLPGVSEKEVFFSTYVCHPSMANNELSGPVVTTALAQWLMGVQDRRYTYRFVFIPETIGSIVYISKNLKHLKQKVFAGFNVTCIGDDRCYSYLPSRAGDTYSDKIAQHVLKHIDPDYKKYSWLDRGSDERQYCAPGVDLPVATIMRSKYGEYPEYHTSLDDLSLVTPGGLEGGFNALKAAVEVIENDCYPKINVLCEPQLGKRGLYPTISEKGSADKVRDMMNFISYCDGEHSLFDISEIINIPFKSSITYIHKLSASGLIKC
ncbi:MAG: DUF4910 domain-containing protein [Gammaproteobacteria bacterium]|nr:DUF4910 domain-containing protein [Gammaproteobacteria bacterium]